MKWDADKPEATSEDMHKLCRTSISSWQTLDATILFRHLRFVAAVVQNAVLDLEIFRLKSKPAIIHLGFIEPMVFL